jgi:hypothetical protein
MSRRRDAVKFIKNNIVAVRHSPRLHAKVLIGNRTALVGSANFTTSGIQCQNEMGMFISDEKITKQLIRWYDGHWNSSLLVPVKKLEEYAEALPEPLSLSRRQKLVKSDSPRISPLLEIKTPSVTVNINTPNMDLKAVNAEPRILSYKSARGYISDGYFYVLKGSIAAGGVSNTFQTISSGRYQRKRDSLIQKEILVRKNDDWDYTFTADYLFSSRSEAAYIIDGNSRSGSNWR